MSLRPKLVFVPKAVVSFSSIEPLAVTALSEKSQFQCPVRTVQTDMDRTKGFASSDQLLVCGTGDVSLVGGGHAWGYSSQVFSPPAGGVATS